MVKIYSVPNQTTTNYVTSTARRKKTNHWTYVEPATESSSSLTESVVLSGGAPKTGGCEHPPVSSALTRRSKSLRKPQKKSSSDNCRKEVAAELRAELSYSTERKPGASYR